jgi:hypothetical protein
VVKAAGSIEESRDDLMRAIIAESGVAQADGAGETARAAITFGASAEHATGIVGDSAGTGLFAFRSSGP